MPSLFDRQFAAASQPVLQHSQGETVTVTPPGGTGTQYTALVDREHAETVTTESGERVRKVRAVRIAASDISDPVNGSQVTIDGVTYHAWTTEAGQCWSTYRVRILPRSARTRKDFRRSEP